MNTSTMEPDLRAILSSVVAAESVFARLGRDPELEDVQRALDLRSTLVKDIVARQSKLEKTLGAGWQDEMHQPDLRELAQEIGARARRIAVTDKAIADFMQAQMNGIQNRLGQLTQTSRAAIGYTFHSSLPLGRRDTNRAA